MSEDKAYIKKMVRVGNSDTGVILPKQLIEKIEEKLGRRIQYWRIRVLHEESKPVLILDPIEYEGGD